MFHFPFPDTVSTRCVHSDELPQCYLHPQEQRLLSEHAVEKRRREFLMGRTAARLALQQLGISSPPPILRGSKREPLWPDAVVGSITHAGDYAVSAVAYCRDVLAIGIDIEKVKADRAGEIARSIADEEEQLWIRQDTELLAQRTLLVFSAKESIFKALYPLCLVFLDYSAVSLVPVGLHKFRADLSKQSRTIVDQHPLLSGLETMMVDYAICKNAQQEQYVVTSTYLDNPA